jgi:hypothetical protein
LRIVWAGIAGLAFGMAMLTGSRSTMIACLVPAIPLLLAGMRRPAFAIASAPVMIGLGVYVLRQVNEYAFSRYGSLETGRVQQARDYISLSISQRPIVGLLGTSGMASDVDESVGTHAHNAYLGAAYIGGLSYLLPLLAIAAVSLGATFIVWRNRKRFDVDPLLTSTLCCLTVVTYAHGFVNSAIYYPTYLWSFIHVTLSILLTTMAAEALRARRAARLPAAQSLPTAQLP